ncbi:4'-phosphopantetheinyl transferase sfp [Ephemeroptericola cinctiostellae]|uniref:4'-phosphopantetheinyl transferase sfp n=2 Tax=Ephemeroptericola cinctiostellae TaxID=2268024 RepID=A0A345DB68_9BURK|nr:4'-phosphopantetheinyl transferase sfp [Ephemeroptericola cinctiostellae]
MRDDMTLKLLLAKYIGQSIEKIKIKRTVLGKPFLVSHPKIHFSVSHTRNFSCIAISSMGEIGVDIENEESSLKDQDLPFTALSRNEQSFCLTQPNKRRAFFSIWTAKEAFLKAIGCGLSTPLSDFSVLPLPNDQSYHFIPHTAALESIQTTFKHYLTEDGVHITYCILT